MGLKKSISQEFTLKEIDKTRNHSVEEIKQNELLNKTYKKVWKISKNTADLLNVASKVTRCASISAFASLARNPVGITSSTGTIKICVITAGIKKM